MWLRRDQGVAPEGGVDVEERDRRFGLVEPVGLGPAVGDAAELTWSNRRNEAQGFYNSAVVDSVPMVRSREGVVISLLLASALLCSAVAPGAAGAVGSAGSASLGAPTLLQGFAVVVLHADVRGFVDGY